MKKLIAGVCAAIAAAVSAFADEAGALPPEAEGKEIRFSMDAGETWTYYESADTFFGDFRWTGNSTTDGGSTLWLIELLCDVEISTKTFQDAGKDAKRRLIFRSCPLAGKVCTLKRAAAIICFDLENYNNAPNNPMTVEFQDIVLDGGAKWVNPLSETATADEMMANDGVAAGSPFIKCGWSSQAILGAGTVVTNVHGRFFQLNTDISYGDFAIKEGARITECRTSVSNPLIEMGGWATAGWHFRMEGGVIDRCYARSGNLIYLNGSKPGEALFSGGRIVDNVMYGSDSGTTFALNLTSLPAGSVVTISGLEISGNYSQCTYDNYQPYGGNVNMAVGGGPGGNKGSVYFTGHPVIRDNYSAAGREIGFTLHQSGDGNGGYVVTGLLERTAWLTLSSAAESYWDTSNPVQEGSLLSGNAGILDGVEASGFERIRHQTGSRTSSVGKDLRVYCDSEGVLRWTKTAVSMYPGSDLAGTDATPPIFVTEISDELTAGLYDLSGTLTLSADTIFSIGSRAGVLEGVKEQVSIPLIQASAIVGFDAFMAAKEDSLQLPKRWALIVREKDGKQQLCLKHTSPGLVILVR